MNPLPPWPIRGPKKRQVGNALLPQTRLLFLPRRSWDEDG